MHPLLMGNFIVETILFVSVAYFYFYLPGKWILNKLHLVMDPTASVVAPTALGIILFTLASYIASWVHLLPIVLLPIAAIALSSLRKMKRIERWRDVQNIPWVFITVLALLFSLPMTLRGIWGTTIVAGGDDMLHLSYTHELVAHFPPDNPGFAGVALRGYHFFTDFFMASVHRLSGIPVESLYYHWIPLLISILVSFGVYSLIVLWTKNKNAGMWAVFLALFGGSFGFILRLLGHTGTSLTSTFGIDQPASATLNTPFAFSLIFITLALLFILHYSKDRTIHWLYLLALVVGVAPIFKIYAGITLFAGFSFLTFWECIHKKYKVIVPFLLAIGIALATYGVFSGAGNYLIYLPLWAPHRMLVANLPWYGFEEKYYTYTKFSVIRGLIEIELFGLFLFLIGNLGTRLFGMMLHGFDWWKKHKAPSLFALTLAAMTGTAILVPLFFIQSVKVFEIIQLTWYYPFFCALVAAPGFALLNSSRMPKFIRWITIGAIICITLPSTYEIFAKNVMAPKVRAPLSTYAPYQFLGSRGTYDDTVLELPPAEMDNSTKSLRAWYEGTSPNFSAYANKRSYFNTMQINFPNLDIDGRAKTLHDMLTFASPSGSLLLDEQHAAQLADSLKKEQIKYIYSSYPLAIASISAHIQEVFASGGIVIYEVKN